MNRPYISYSAPRGGSVDDRVNEAVGDDGQRPDEIAKEETSEDAERQPDQDLLREGDPAPPGAATRRGPPRIRATSIGNRSCG